MAVILSYCILPIWYASQRMVPWILKHSACIFPTRDPWVLDNYFQYSLWKEWSSWLWLLREEDEGNQNRCILIINSFTHSGQHLPATVMFRGGYERWLALFFLHFSSVPDSNNKKTNMWSLHLEWKCDLRGRRALIPKDARLMLSFPERAEAHSSMLCQRETLYTSSSLWSSQWQESVYSAFICL